jgi:hypothetical protein
MGSKRATHKIGSTLNCATALIETFFPATGEASLSTPSTSSELDHEASKTHVSLTFQL